MRKRMQPPASTGVSAGLPQMGGPIPSSLQAQSQFIRRVSCPQCAGPKVRPSRTAYVYCDFCGTLMDYDFRMANANTNAGITNTVFHRLMSTVQVPLAHARQTGDRTTVEQIYRHVFTQWLQECPMAASPRAMTDQAFRQQFIHYKAACATTKELDPDQVRLQQRHDALAAQLQRIPTPGGAWRVAGPFWELAELWKEQMSRVYALIRQQGVDQLDPDRAPPEIALRMEHTTFCQAWLPHLSAEEGARLVNLYGLDAEYTEVGSYECEHRRCGACGFDIEVLEGARQVVCDACGVMADVGGGAIPCKSCGWALSLPVGVEQVPCPSCATPVQRV